MNNAPERIAREAAGAFAPTMSMDGVADAVTSALATAGWLRLSPMSLDAKQQIAALTMQRDDALAEVTRLTRERDEAQKMRDYHEGRQRIAEESFATLGIELAAVRKERDEANRDSAAWMRDYDAMKKERAALRATQSSPEVLAVKRIVDAARIFRRRGDGCGELYDAVDALAAVQRKAEPKPEPRWTTERYNGIDALPGQWCVMRGMGMHGPFPADVCHALAIALNAADAAGRKS